MTRMMIKGLMDNIRNMADVHPIGNEAFAHVRPDKIAAEFGTWQGVVGRGEAVGHQCLKQCARE
eukprot:526863-Prorocentrum_minimum.AAC.1